MATPRDVAEWMLSELHKHRYLYQETAVYDAHRKFGTEFTQTNESGNLAFDRRVLKEFRKLTEPDVVWERGERMWRLRTPHDPPGKRQAD